MGQDIIKDSGSVLSNFSNPQYNTIEHRLGGLIGGAIGGGNSKAMYYSASSLG